MLYIVMSMHGAINILSWQVSAEKVRKYTLKAGSGMSYSESRKRFFTADAQLYTAG